MERLVEVAVIDRQGVVEAGVHATSDGDHELVVLDLRATVGVEHLSPRIDP